MMVDDTLGVAGGAGGIEERQRIPFVLRSRPGERRIALGEERFVGERANGLSLRSLGIVDVDDENIAREPGERRLDRRREFGVGNERFRPSVLEAEGDGRGVETDVERVEHGAERRHGVVRFEESGHIRRHCGDGVAGADATTAECRGELPATRFEIAIGARDRAVPDGDLVRPDECAALEELHGRQRNVVRCSEFLDLHAGLTDHLKRRWP